MAIKLNKAEQLKMEALKGDIDKIQAQLEDEVNDANQKIADIVEHLNGFIKAFNEKATELKEYIDEKASDWRNEWDERSEAGQQNERGQVLDEFISEWENSEVEEIPDVTPEEIELEYPEIPSLETLPAEPAI
jgi:translation elongation factor EF-G